MSLPRSDLPQFGYLRVHSAILRRQDVRLFEVSLPDS
jgi:hypothetical protein